MLVLGDRKLIWGKFKTYFLLLIWELGFLRGWSCRTQARPQRLEWEMWDPLQGHLCLSPGSYLDSLEPDLLSPGPHTWHTLTLHITGPARASYLSILWPWLWRASWCCHETGWDTHDRKCHLLEGRGLSGKAHTAFCDVGSKVLLQEWISESQRPSAPPPSD